MPDKVVVPPVMVSEPPVPEMTPLKVPLPLVMVRFLLPKLTVLPPVRLVMEVLVVMALILNVPKAPTATPEELAMEPEPDRASVPLEMVVAPV